ncbi:MAG: beta-aspartyl-peptidase [bacterium]
MLKLLKNLNIYNPEPVGIADILTAGEKIVAISKNIKPPRDIDCDVFDCTGKIAIPGIIDAHVHIAGAGGEGGPATRTPEIQLSSLTEAGVTSVVGSLGTDGFTRNVESVLMKARALKSEGLSAWICTGSYQIPTTTITGDIGRDIALIDEVVGVGEIAISDHRSSVPNRHELIRTAEHARVGGMLVGKAGIVNIHMGDAKNPFAPLYDAVKNSMLPLKQFLPTHCNRNRHIFTDAQIYGKKGFVDITSSSYEYFPDIEIKPSEAVKTLLEKGVPISNITMTSDSNGSLPDYDEDGNLRRLEMGKPASLLKEIKDMILSGIPPEQAFSTVTKNPADIFKLSGKGYLKKGFDADINIFSKDWDLTDVFARGCRMMKEGVLLKKGTYEKQLIS